MNPLLLARDKPPITGPSPADPLATQAARNLYAYLYSLKSRSDKKVISGQRHMSTINTIFAQQGIWVGILMTEPANVVGDPSTFNSYANDAVTIRQTVLDWWNAGGIPYFDLRPRNPVDRGTGGPGGTLITQQQMIAARTEDGNQYNANLRFILDKWCDIALWLQANGVAFITRTLAEHNGTNYWFWDNPDCANFYRYIRNYCVNVRGVHNALWAHAASWWGNNNGPPDDPHQVMMWYPGNDIIDIVGMNYYPNLGGSNQWPPNAHLQSDWYAKYKATGKIIAFTEFGPTAPQVTVHADMRKLINAIRQYTPDVCFWTCWSGVWSMDSTYNDFVRELLTDPWVVNRNDIPNLR